MGGAGFGHGRGSSEHGSLKVTLSEFFILFFIFILIKFLLFFVVVIVTILVYRNTILGCPTAVDLVLRILTRVVAPALLR